MNISLSGSTGFVGRNLIPYLQERNREVKPIDLRNTPSDQWIGESEVIIHLAGLAHDLKNTRDSNAYHVVNFELTRDLFDQFLKSSNSKVFIFISSIKALKDHADDWLTETMEPDPSTPYGISKRRAEAYLLDHTPNDKTVIILRPCMIHGPGNKGNLNLLYQVAKRGLPWPLGAFENQRSFLSIQNFCFVIEQLVKNPIPSGIYHISDNEPVSTNQIIRLMAQGLNKKPIIWKLPKGFVQGIAYIGTYLKLPLNQERLSKLTENYRVSNRKLMEALGTVLPVDALEGLTHTITSFE